MTDILISLWGLMALITAGYILAKTGVAPRGSDRIINRICFALPLPCMIFLAVANVDISHVFSRGLLINVVTAILLFGAYYALAVKVFHLRGGEQTIGALTASYTNAGNIGIPYLLAITGDPTMGPAIMLFQLAVMMPIAFSLLGRQTGKQAGQASQQEELQTQQQSQSQHRRSPLLISLTSVVKQPPLYGLILGLIWSIANLPIPQLISEPAELLASATVPMLMLSVGINSARSHLPALNRESLPLIISVAMRLIISPLLTYALALAFHVHGTMLLTSMIAASFPVANNVFIFSTKYETGEELARNAMVLSTLLSFPVVVVIVFLFR